MEAAQPASDSQTSDGRRASTRRISRVLGHGATMEAEERRLSDLLKQSANKPTKQAKKKKAKSTSKRPVQPPRVDLSMESEWIEMLSGVFFFSVFHCQSDHHHVAIFRGQNQEVH